MIRAFFRRDGRAGYLERDQVGTLQRAGVTKQAMSQLVRLMERQGYLEQVPDPTDTRAKVVRMTPRGESVKTACVEVREELNRTVSGALGREAAEQLAANLDAAAGLFGEISGTRPQNPRRA